MAWAYKYMQTPSRRQRKKLDGSWPTEVAPNIVCISVTLGGLLNTVGDHDWYWPAANETSGYYDPYGKRIPLPFPFRLFAIGIGNVQQSGGKDYTLRFRYGTLINIGEKGSDKVALGTDGKPTGETSIISPNSPDYDATQDGLRVLNADITEARNRYIYYARDGHFSKINFNAFDYLCIQPVLDTPGAVSHEFFIFGMFLDDKYP